MIVNIDKISQEAHHLALQHDPSLETRASRQLWEGIESNIRGLRAFVEELHTGGSTCTQPAEEWLLDHAEFIESEVLGIKDDLSKSMLRGLPCLSKTGELRIMSVCEHYLALTDGLMSEETFITYIRSYQEVSVLHIAELSAIPVMLRITAIRKLSGVMEMIRERRAICTLVERILASIKPSELSPDRLRTALDDAGVSMPLSGATTVHLVQHLREHAQDTANVGEWLICKLENGEDSMDAILSYEYQLQAAKQVTTGHLIGTLRTMSRWVWADVFEQLCLVEQTLREEQAGDYPRLDAGSREVLRIRVARLARRMKVPENLVATEAVGLADTAYTREVETVKEGALLPRSVYAAYYLLEPGGMVQLREALKRCGKTGAMPETSLLRRATGTYFNTLAVSFALAMLAAAIWIGWDGEVSFGEGAVILLALALPMSEWAVTAVHWLIERVRRPSRLLRYDLSQGIPEEATTMVVIPIIWSRLDEVEALVDRLELHYLANRGDHLHFALLSDLKDADSERTPQDRLVLEAARSRIQKLNDTYPGGRFHLFQRKRLWNEREKSWMGWERKRGKLVEFVDLLKGTKDTSYNVTVGDASVLGRIRYIITLDADTQLPLESAHRLVGAMHLPYNRPRLNDQRTRVVEGYGVLQPRIGMTLEAASRSRLAGLWAGDPGMDPYAYAVSDPYQDSLGQGIFTGKGIFDVDAFHELLCERIPENRVLSHDLLEGGYLRAGLISDIELVDDHPATFSAHQKRLHRWVRGDWQLLLWLLPKTRNRRGELQPVDLSVLTRWQIIDNLRRSLMAPALMAVLLLGVTVLPGPAWRWVTLVLATLLIPVFRQLLQINGVIQRPRHLGITLGHVMLNALTLPYQSVLMVDAIVRTLYRLGFSKRRLLEWVNQAEVDRASKRKGAPALIGLFGGYLLTAVWIAAVIWHGGFTVLTLGLALALLWVTAPMTIRMLDQPSHREEEPFEQLERDELVGLSKDIWSFYEDYVTEQDHWLPPDNVQFEPPNGVAHRTSPTNIGLYMTCALAARDFEFIDTPGLIERLERTVDTIEQMEKWNGHLYNWYDTETLAPLHPVYVSTVDSGNFVACLMAVKEGVVEYIQAEERKGKKAGGDELRGRRDDEFKVAFAEEIAPDRSKRDKPEKTVTRKVNWVERGRRLTERIETLVQGSDFRPLYDYKARLFSLGYHVGHEKRDTVLYDLMASEARQASFVAIALGQVSVSHWTSLGRTMTKAGNQPVLLSWSGTMFEYLMPWLLMRTYRGTVWDQTYQAVVDRQIEYARGRNVPFGISESGFYAFDYQMNYQYKAFGVPGLGFKRGLDEELVVAPYATVMALPYAKREGLAALRQMEQLGARGKYGYYEAMDFTEGRLPEGSRHQIIRSFMAHHQGMSLLTLSNMLLPRTMIDRFHRNKQVRAAELLLQERMPAKPALVRHTAMLRDPEAQTRPAHDPAEIREFVSPHTPAPETCVLSNGKFTSVLTASGSGVTRYEGLSVSRWREDPVRDAWGPGVYIRDTTSDELWSPSFYPARVETAKQRTEFELDRVTYVREKDDMQTRMEVCVSPEWNAEVRRITLKNKGPTPRVLEVTTFVELALASSIADDAHPAFSKLFVRTEFDETEECLIAGRRPREAKDRTLWAAHALTADASACGPLEFETDRAAFIGRGHQLSEPQAMRTRLFGKTGSVADPAFVMRRRVEIAPGQEAQLFAVTSVADTKAEAVEVLSRLQTEEAVERTFRLAWNRGRIELRHLNLSYPEAVIFHRFASQVLYTPPLQEEREASIRANIKGQSGLWSYGVSGDRPVVLVHIDHRSHLPFIIKLLTGHEYLRRLGILFDLVILNESESGYYQDLQEALQRAAEQGVDRFGAGLSGVTVIPVGTLPGEDKTLLLAVARVTLRAGGSSFKAQLRLAEEEREWPPMLTPTGSTAMADTPPAPDKYDPKDWQLFNGWGGFSPDGRAYHILIRDGNHLPAPWINVIANKTFGTIQTELGTGYTWWRNSRECKLTPWSNDPVLDPPAEKSYLRDEESGEVWSLTPSATEAAPPYRITHGRGYTRFEHDRLGIESEMNVFVPLEDPVKIMRVRLKNRSAVRRSLSLTYYAEWVLGVQRHSNAPFIVTEWDAENEMLIARNQYQENFRDATAFLGMYPQPKANGPAADERGLSSPGWTSDRHEFIGRNGTLEQPAALKRTGLSGTDGAHYESCGAIQHKLTLGPGEEQEVVILLGCDASREAIGKLANTYRAVAAGEKAMSEVTAFWERTLDQIHVSTPSREMDVMLNGWLLYQSLACRMWARTAFYQAGGAFGFRDQLQDSLAVLHTMPEATRAQILIHAAHQYEEGDVQHWWHEETERGIRTLFSDDLLWMPYVVSRYVEHTGDRTVLEETRPFLTSPPLTEGEHERYEETVQSSQTGTVYEHSLRAIDKALERIGEHGLPLIGVGDWNDGMNLVGDEGRGESIWLGWFLCEVLKRFEALCTERGDTDRATRYAEARAGFTAALNEHGWDGQWYRRAYTDDGTWLGSIHNTECRIDAIAQSWSVISGAAPPDRALQAMQSFERELVERELSVVRLLTPPFDETEPSPGYIQGYPPGIRENGAQYTHGVIWSIMAWCRLGRGDKAFELFHMLNPINHTRTDQEVRRYVAEPYVMAADVYTADPHKGHAGWTWYTGASGWMYQVGVEWILGIRRRAGELVIDPSIPADWPGYTATYRHGRTSYVIKVTQSKATKKERRLTIGGQVQSVAVDREIRITLTDDGKTHEVTLDV